MSLYENIHKKRKRIKEGSGERMKKRVRKVGLLQKILKMLQKLQKKCTQNRHRCNRNPVITRYIGA